MKNIHQGFNQKQDNNFLYKLFSILFVIVSMIVIWILFGEFNQAKLNWLVPHHGIRWGELKDQTIGYGVNPDGLIVRWEIFIVMLSVLITSLLAATILIKFNKFNLLFLTYIVTIWFCFSSLIISGMLSYDRKSISQWVIIVRIIIVVISFPISFFSSNFIFKKLFVKTSNAVEYANKLIRDEQNAKVYIDENISYRNKSNDEETIVVED